MSYEPKIFRTLGEELKEKIDELERYKNTTVGRELRMIELKKRIEELEQKLKDRSSL